MTTKRNSGLIPFESMRHELLTPFDSLIDDFFTTNFPEFSSHFGLSFTNKARPKVDIIDCKDKIVLKAEISGLSKEDVKIHCRDNYLTITGEKKESFNEKSEGVSYLRKELSHSKFSRTFELGEKLDSKNIKAEFKDGLLTIDIPKLEKLEKEESYEIKID